VTLTAVAAGFAPVSTAVSAPAQTVVDVRFREQAGQKSVVIVSSTLEPGTISRHIGNYRLDGLDPTIRASGLDVLDLAITKQLRHWVAFNLGIDNLAGKPYYETQNYFESRVTPSASAVSRIHAITRLSLRPDAGSYVSPLGEEPMGAKDLA
jgi:hypothetical protein